MNSFFENLTTGIAYNNLYTDYRAEAVALNLMKYYRDVDEFFLTRLGGNDRAFRKDVESIAGHIQDLEQKAVSIYTYRESIYDYLPEGVFHPPSLGNYRNGVSDIIFQVQKQKKTEAGARRFFRPFEMESYYVLLSALFEETHYDLVSNSDALMNIIYELWPLLKQFDVPAAKVFTCLLPFFHAARGNKDWLEKCLTAFLQVPVKIFFTPNKINDIEEAATPLTLSQIRLGISTVLNGSHADGERNWDIHIGIIPYDKLKDYLPASNLRKLLRLLYSYCIPATVMVEEHFITEKKQDSFVLGKDVHTNLLGYSTFL